MDSTVTVNIDNHERRFVTSAKEDRISNLPDSLIDSILERLPVQDAVRTHVLSNNWRYKWATMRSLVLDKHFSEKLAKNGAFGHDGFITITNQLFHFLKGPILKLHLHIPNICFDSFQEVNQWILSLSRDHIRELVFTNSNQRYQLPCHFFQCLELRMLQLQNCIFNPPREFQGYLYLEDVYLENIEFGGNLYGTVINLPRLEKLYLSRCTRVYNFNIKAAKLNILMVIRCPDAVLLPLLHNQWLTRVDLVINRPILQYESIKLATILSNLPYLVSFSMDGYFLQFAVEEKIPKWLPDPANRLKTLRLFNFVIGDLHQLQGALCALRNSPNLEMLHVRNVQMVPDDMDIDVTPAICYLEGSDCLNQTFNRLKTIEMINVEESRPLLLFIKLLLDHSPTFEMMSIRPSAADVHKRLNFAKNVMCFPRASSKAKILYLDP